MYLEYWSSFLSIHIVCNCVAIISGMYCIIGNDQWLEMVQQQAQHSALLQTDQNGGQTVRMVGNRSEWWG